MWIINIDGFYSVVEGPTPDQLLVRSRSWPDADRMADRLAAYIPRPSIEQTPARDYPYRVIVPRDAVARVAADAVGEIDYGNFKEAVAERRGWSREGVYAEVWLVLRRIQYPLVQARNWLLDDEYEDDLLPYWDRPAVGVQAPARQKRKRGRRRGR